MYITRTLSKVTNFSVHHRLLSEREEELALDQLSKDLKILAKQMKITKYGEVMKLLRLALSGLQVPEHITVIHHRVSYLKPDVVT